MAASTYISDTENVSNNQLDESINNSYITNYQSSSVVKSEPLDGESLIEPEGVAEKNNEDTNIFQRTDFGLWDIEQRCLEEKNVSLKTDECVENVSVPQHEEALDEENGKFSCDICGKVFTQIIDLRKHTKIHKQSIKCDLCNRCFPQKSQLQTHMKIHNRNTVNKCAFCEKTFKRKNAFQMHMDALHTMTSCDICGQQVPGTLMFQYHTLAHEHEKKSCDFCCDACGEIYKTVDSFRTHLEIHKNDGIPYTCEICGKTFTTITSIGRHMSSHKNNPSDTHQSSYPSSDFSESNDNSVSTSQTLKVSHVQNFISVFICELCDETFLCKLKLETHYESHKTECRECKQCKKTFDTGTALKKHVENVHMTTTCNICGKEVSKNDLKTHKAELHTKDKYTACAKKYSGLNGEKSHIPTSISKEEKKYSCDICGKRFAQTSGIRRHMIFHQQKIKCDMCGRHFSTMRSLRSHMKIHLRTEFPKCEICDQSFKTKVVLQRHIRTHHTTETCDICGLQINRQLMGNHKLAHEHESKSQDFICSICEDSFNTANSFRTHLEIHKDEDRPYTCEVCGKTFIAIKNIKDHARSHRDRSDELPDSEASDKNESSNKNLKVSELLEDTFVQKTKLLLTCDFCGKMFSKKWNLDAHLKTHQSVEMKCDKCEKVFKTENALKNHINNEHTSKPCEVCGKIFTKGELKRHRAEHIHKKQYNCDVCGKTFSGMNAIKRHMSVHVNDKKYSCDICGKRFVQTTGLKTHMRFHQQSIKCGRCGRCFSQRTRLNLHMKIHLRSIFPKCEICDQSFKTKVVLQRHTRTYHTTETCDICGLQINRQLMGNHKLAHEHESKSQDFICSICEDSFKTADSFRTHLEIHKDEDRPYTCEVCGKTFIAINNIKDHARCHRDRSDKLPDSEASNKNESSNKNLQVSELLENTIVQKTKLLFTCDFCGKMFSKKWNLDVHLKTHQNVEMKCDKCEKVFKTENALKKHINNEHTSKPCEVCGKIFTKGELKRHRAEHIHKKQYSCDVCGKNFSGMNAIKRHVSVHVNDKKYSRDICGKRFVQTTGLKRHKRFHQQSIKCDRCGRCFSQRSHLSSHMKIHQRTVFPKCEICDKSFKTKVVLQRHIRTYHTTETCDICGLQINRQLMGNHKLAHEHESKSQDFICSICEDSFKTADSFRTHLEIHKDEDRPFTCEVCGKTFIAINNIKDHARFHRDLSDKLSDSEASDKNESSNKNLQVSELLEDTIVQKPKFLFTCDFCGKMFSKKWNLDVHLKTHQSVEMKCDKCEKVFKTENALKKHINNEHTSKPCEVCGKIFTKGELKRHRAEHIHKKQYNCDVCGKNFSGMNAIKRHMSVHVNDKKYSCDICGKRFVQTTGLKRHKRFHQQSIKCDRCGRCFSQKAQLSLHMKIHLRTVLPKCEFCDKSFKTKVVLQRHMRSFHTTETCDICGLQINRQLMGNHKLAHEHESKSQDFICSICEDSFKTADSFRTHLEIHKDEDRPYTCEICGKTFIAIVSMKEHSRSHRGRAVKHEHQDSENLDENRIGNTNLHISEPLDGPFVQERKSVFICDFCGKIFPRKCNLNEHLRIHQCVDKNCDKCEKTFKTEIALNNHIDLAHTEKLCDICGKKLSKGEMKHHRAEHVNKKIHKCDVCGKQFSSLNGLRAHMSVHINDKKYICEICGKRFVQPSGLKMHMEFHQQSIKCDKCGRCFSQRGHLNLHMKIHLRTVFPKCEFCDKSFKTKAVLQRHMRSFHTTVECDRCGLQIHRQLMGNHKLAHEYESNSRDFICSICEDSFKTADSFRTHLEIHKDEDRPYTCEICGKTFIAIKSITDHARLHIERSNTNQDSKDSDKNGRGKKTLQMPEDLEDSIVEKKMFPCDLCGKMFSRKYLLDVHLRIHQNVEKNCDKCEKTFKTEIALKNHIDLVHTEKPCEVCGKILTKGELKHHWTEHILKKQYKCDMCFKEFFRLSELKRHMSVHVNDKKYICDICGKRFLQTRGLKMHMRFHQQSIKCEKCGRCFSQKSQLSLHMKIHLRTVLPKCEFCDKSFKTKVVLQRHMRSFHTTETCDICGLQIHRQLMGNHKLAHEYESNSRDFICSICEDSFKTADSFRTHLEIHKDEDRPYTCEICGKTFIAIKSITDHARLHIERSNTNQDSKDSDKNGRGKKNLQMPEDLEDSIVEKKMFPCDLCGKMFSRKYLLDVHLRIHQNVEKNCDKCEKTFKTEIALKNHIDLAHTEKPCEVCGKILTKGKLKHHRTEHILKKQYKCDMCFKEFSRLCELKRHMSVHVNDKKYICDICGKRFVQTTGLKMHMRFHQQSIKCEKCGRCFSQKAQLRLHMKIHLRTVFPKCEFCDKSFKTKVVLQRHMRSFHTTETCDICGLQIHRQLMGNHKLAHEYESKSQDFICSVCEDSFKTADSFRTHLEIHKDEDRPYTCEICGKTFIAIKGITDHARLHIERSNTNQDSKDSDKNGRGKKNLQLPKNLEDSIVKKTKMMFPCDLCCKTFSRKDNLDVHLRIHVNVEKNCDKCEKTFKTEIALKNHIDLAHTENPCEVCGKILTKRELKHHRAEHVNKKLHKCDVCGKQFSRLNGLKTHMSVHVNDKKYICDICGKRFVQTTGLEKHMRFHQQSIKCDRCGRCFSQRTHLSSHMKIHLRTEFPKCEFCDKSFKTKVVLQWHMRSYHTTESCDICGLQINRQLMGNHKLAHDNERNSRYFICSICEDSFKTADSFRTHLEIHKNDDRPYTCEVCGKAFITVKILRSHVRLHRERFDTHQDSATSYDKKGSSNKNLQKTNPVFTCDLCGKIFQMDRHLQNHIKKVHRGLPSDICSEKLTHHQMSLQEKTVHPSDCICDICGVSFPDLKKLRRHSEKHRTSKFHAKPTMGSTVEDIFKCDICCKGFTSSRKLFCHRKFHKNTCNICGKCFSGKTALSTHMLRYKAKTHETICKQKYKCSVCRRQLRTNLHLKNHYRKHIKLEKAVLTCEGCALTFTSKEKREAHFNALHVKKPCNVCKKKFLTVLLKGHKKLHDLGGKGLISKDTQDRVKILKGKRGHKRESMIPYLKPKEINMDSILMKKSQISNRSSKEQERLNDDRNFFHCIVRKCIDELGITSIKGDNFTRLKSKVKEWVLNMKFDEAGISEILKTTATKNIGYNKRRKASMSK